MMGWLVFIAPQAIIRNSRKRSANDVALRRSLNPKLGIRTFNHLSTVCGILAEVSGRLATIVLLGFTLILGLYGIERSLWLDEAWVANSVHAPTLQRMFYYPNWLQTSPPLFLLLARSAIGLFGLTTVVLRSVPLLLSLVAVAAMLAVARRVVSPAYAVLATAILAFHPTSVEYFRAFKQYGGEVAATAVVLWAAVAYLQKPDRKQFYGLLVVTIAAMTLSYPTVFLLPGVVAAVGFGNSSRAATLAGICAAVLAVLYWFLIRPNYTAALRAYWMGDPEVWLTPSTIAAVVLCVGFAARIAWTRNTVGLTLLTPCVLLFASELLGWYPASPRTHMFVRPCFILLLLIVLEDLAKLTKWKWDAIVLVAAAVVIFLGVRKQFHEGRFQAEEDMAGAVRYLHMNVTPSDLVLVHASLREGFLLYTAIQGWTAKPVIYGDTGWPCCPRAKPAGVHISTPEKIRRDLDSKIPQDFHGRIWLFYTNRPLHWEYVRVEDSKLWQNYFWNRDCRPELYIRFANLGLTPMTCAASPLHK
jgi:hypothetical protein